MPALLNAIRNAGFMLFGAMTLSMPIVAAEFPDDGKMPVVASPVISPGNLYPLQFGAFARRNSISETDGKITGQWANSIVSACFQQPPLTYVDKSVIKVQRVAGACANGEEVFFVSRFEQPIAPTGHN